MDDIRSYRSWISCDRMMVSFIGKFKGLWFFFLGYTVWGECRKKGQNWKFYQKLFISEIDVNLIIWSRIFIISKKKIFLQFGPFSQHSPHIFYIASLNIHFPNRVIWRKSTSWRTKTFKYFIQGKKSDVRYYRSGIPQTLVEWSKKIMYCICLRRYAGFMYSSGFTQNESSLHQNQFINVRIYNNK